MNSLFSKVFIIINLFISSQLFSYSVAQNLKVSVITIGPSQEELYSAFGHSGIRVIDDSLGIDYFYNYGVFDFDQPNFYLNFLKGKLLYMVVKYDYSSVKEYYISNNRDIKEQILSLSLNQKIDLFKYLENNILEENKYYSYNYLYDNCATKIRDVLNDVFPNYIYYDFQDVSYSLSYRELMDLYLSYQKWGDLGIDICLGVEIDKIAEGYNTMYLPDYLFSSLSNAKTTKGEKLISEEINIFSSRNISINHSFFGPWETFFFLFIFLLFISFRERKYDIWYKKLDFLIFLITGSIGFLLLFLWFFTDHISAYNYNIIWALPVNFIVAFFFFNKKMLNQLKHYFLFYSIFLMSLILLWNFIPQKLNNSLFFLILLLLIRSFLVFLKIKKILTLKFI